MDMSKQRTVYIKPAIEIIEIENEGVIASSGLIGGSQGNPGVYSSSYRRRTGNSRGSSASLNDLEDLIEDILTVGD